MTTPKANNLFSASPLSPRSPFPPFFSTPRWSLYSSPRREKRTFFLNISTSSLELETESSFYAPRCSVLGGVWRKSWSCSSRRRSLLRARCFSCSSKSSSFFYDVFTFCAVAWSNSREKKKCDQINDERCERKEWWIFFALFSFFLPFLVSLSFCSFLASGKSFFLSFFRRASIRCFRTKIKTTGALCALFLSLFSRITPIYAQKGKR